MITDDTNTLIIPEGEVVELSSDEGLLWERAIEKHACIRDSIYVTRNAGIKSIKAFGCLERKRRDELWCRYKPVKPLLSPMLDSSGRYAVYDTVKEIYGYYDGSTFIENNRCSGEEIIKIEYLRGDVNQYYSIPTNIISYRDRTYIIRCKADSINAKATTYSYCTNTTRNNVFGLTLNSRSNTVCASHGGNKNTMSGNPISVITTNWITYTSTYDNNANIAYLLHDDSNKANIIPHDSVSCGQIYLFSPNDNIQQLNENIYISQFTAKTNFGIESDCIPVRINNVGYFLDTVSWTLLANTESGVFTLGPDIPEMYDLICNKGLLEYNNGIITANGTHTIQVKRQDDSIINSYNIDDILLSVDDYIDPIAGTGNITKECIWYTGVQSANNFVSQTGDLTPNQLIVRDIEEYKSIIRHPIMSTIPRRTHCYIDVIQNNTLSDDALDVDITYIGK